MDISIIIPTYNRNSILYKNLATARDELKGLDYEIIVVNDSKNNQVAIPSEWQGNIICVNNPKQGVASARNLGASLARSGNLVFVDDDMMLNRKAVEGTMEYLKKNKNVCLNINWIYPDELKHRLESYSFGRYLEHFGFTSLRGWMGKDYDWKEDQVTKATGITSQFLAMSREVFDRTGGYNENFPFAGFEDHDFWKKLEKTGTTPYLDTGLMIWHNEEDRLQMKQWLDRKYRGGQTRFVAVEMGHSELTLEYNNLKGGIYFILSKIEFAIVVIANVIPNHKIFDPIYFRIVNLLLGLNLYKGYTK